MRHDHSSRKTFREFKVRQNFVEGLTSLINGCILKFIQKSSQESSKLLCTAQPEWTSLALESTQLGMASCSRSAIAFHTLFHIKIKHIENCFCSVEQSLPLVNKAQSLAMLLAWLTILTKPKSLPDLWGWVWSTRTFRSSSCISRHQVICSDHHHWAKLLEPDYSDYSSLTTLTTWAWLPWLLEPDYPDDLSLTTLTAEPDYPDYLSLTTLTTWAWLLEPDYLSLTTWAWLPLILSLNVWQPSGSC